MGDNRIINANLTNLSEINSSLNAWIKFAREFLVEHKPKTEIDYVGIREVIFEFRFFQMKSHSMDGAVKMLAEIKENLEKLKYENAAEIQMKFTSICKELDTIKCEFVKMFRELQENCSFLKQVYDKQKLIAAHIDKFKQLIKVPSNGVQNEEMYKSKDEIDKMLCEHKEFCLQIMRARLEMYAIISLEKDIDEILQSALLSKVENPHSKYITEEMDKDWKELVRLENKKDTFVRRQLHLYKLWDGTGSRENIARVNIEDKLYKLMESIKILDDMGITQNPHITATMDDLMAKHREYLDKLAALTSAAQTEKAASKPQSRN